MKKSIILSIGALVIFLLLAVWGYLFFFGTPESSDEFFTDLGLNGEVDTSYVPPPVEVATSTPTVNMKRPKLRQLTTKPVAGFAEIIRSTTTPAVVYYVEQGNGHIFTIDTKSGEEVRVSRTTVAQAERAHISKDGRFAAISSFSNNKNKPLFVGAFPTSTVGMIDADLTEVLSVTGQDFVFGEDEVLYSTVGAAGLIGTAYNLSDETTDTLFTLPITEARIQWGSSSAENHYLYPKATYALEGFLYEITKGTLSRLPVSGFGLTANVNADLILFTKVENASSKSYVYNRTDASTKPLDAVVLPEKCLLPETGLEFVCPFESIKVPYEFPDGWYKGTLSFKDSLWLLNAENMSGEKLVDTFAESSREIDAIGMQVSSTGNVLYFINKNDNTLWMYEI